MNEVENKNSPKQFQFVVEEKIKENCNNIPALFIFIFFGFVLINKCLGLSA